jgi:uncharacterized protein (TIGR03435 family)
MRALAAMTFFALTCGPAFSQPDGRALTFEAASIKPFPEGTPRAMSGCLGGPGSDDPGRINCEYATLRMFLMRAYQVKNREIFGPGWMDSVHFNLTAKVPTGASKDDSAAMFRNLLAERFHVELHRENRILPAYSLTVAKGGVKMKEWSSDASSTDEPPPGGKLPTGKDGFPILRRSSLAGGPIILYRMGRARLQADGSTTSALAMALTNQLDMIVTDETGLTGKYEMILYWTPDTVEVGGAQRPRATGSGPESLTAQDPTVDLFAALEQQLGLKLVSKKVSRDVLVIDRADKVPTEN